jgi:hypothetical protein
MKKNEVTSLGVKLSSYYKRTGISLALTLTSGFFFILGFLIDFAVSKSNKTDIFGSYSSYIFSPILVVSGILFIVFFIQLSFQLRKIGKVEESTKFFSNCSSIFHIIGIILLINSLFFVYMRIQDNIFLLSRIIAVLGLVCITFGFFYQRKYFNVLYNLKHLPEESKTAKKNIFLSTMILIIVLVDSILRQIFKEIFFEYFCYYSKCSKRLGIEYFNKINYLNFISLLLIAFFVLLLILQIFKTRNYLINISKPLEEKFNQISEIPLNRKINRLSKILTLLVSISVPNVALFFLFLKYPFSYVIETSLGGENHIALTIQFGCYGISFSIASIIIFILYIISLNKLSNFNMELKRNLKIASVSSVLGTVFLLPGLVFAEIYYQIDYWYYFGRIFIGLCLIMFLIGSFSFHHAFRKLYKKGFLKTKSSGSRLCLISVISFFLIFVIETVLRITFHFIYRTWVCYTHYCHWEYKEQFESLSIILNWVNFALILFVFIFMIAGIRLIGKDTLKIKETKKQLLISELKKPLNQKILVSTKLLSFLIFFSLLITLVLFMKEFIEWDKRQHEYFFNTTIWTFFGIFIGLSVIFLIIFLVQNYKLLTQYEKTKKRGKLFIYTFSGFILFIIIGISVHVPEMRIDLDAFICSRILILIALVLLCLGYSQLEKGILRRDKKGILFASSLSFLIAYIFDFIVRFVYIGINSEKSCYGRCCPQRTVCRIHINSPYYENTKWLYFVNIIVFSLLIIFHIISLYWFQKEQLLQPDQSEKIKFLKYKSKKTSVNLFNNNLKVLLFSLPFTLLFAILELSKAHNLIFVVFLGFSALITIICLAIFFTQNYKILDYYNVSRKKNLVIYASSISSLVLIISAVFTNLTQQVLDFELYLSSRILFSTALILLSIGYYFLSKQIKTIRKKNRGTKMLFFSSLSLIFVFIFEFITRTINLTNYTNIICYEDDGCFRIISHLYFERVSWLTYFNMVIFSVLVIIHIIGFILNRKEISPIIEKIETTKVSETKIEYCTNCGKEIDDISDFCVYCGIKIKKNNKQI